MSLIGAIKRGKVLSVDPSTHSLAFSVMTWDKLESWGKISLKTPKMEDKIAIIAVTLPHILKFHNPTHFVIEQSIYIQNPDTSRKLAYINGCTLATVLSSGYRNASDVPPLVWKPYIGYKKVSAAEKKEWATIMTPTEVKKKAEFERKDRVKRIIDVRIPNHGCKDYDIIDSMGIGLWSLGNIL